MKLYKAVDRRIFTDRRGLIDNILPDGETIKSVAYITGVVGAVRGNHYHLEDEHYCLVLNGRIEYSWIEKKGSKRMMNSIILESGDLIHTPTREPHRFVFLTEGIFLALSKRSRDEESYESDTIKEEF